MRRLLVEAYFKRNLALCKLFDEIGIVEGGKTVADALGTEVERSPDRFRRAAFACVCGQAHAVVCGPGVGIAKKFGWGFLLIAADADGDYVAVVILNRELEDFLRGFGAELADGVEDPEQGDAEVACATGAAAVEAFEDGGEILLAPEADSDRNIHFGVQHAFFFQALHQAVGDEFVVFGRAQVLGDVFEGEQEAGEIFVAVERVDFGLRDAFAAALAEFEQRGGFDCAFEMQVEFGLGELAEEAARRTVECWDIRS